MVAVTCLPSRHFVEQLLGIVYLDGCSGHWSTGGGCLGAPTNVTPASLDPCSTVIGDQPLAQVPKTHFIVHLNYHKILSSFYLEESEMNHF